MPPASYPLMIFGAGFGTRMGPLTADRPKPLIEVAGVPLIDRALSIAQAAGAGPIVINTHYLHDRMAAHLATAPVTLSHETPRILDTGGGLRQALPLLGRGPVQTLNPDCIWTGDNPLMALADAWRPGMGALLLLIPPDRARGRQGGGDFECDAEGRLTRAGPCVHTGAQIIDPAALGGIEEVRFSLNLVWDRLIERRALFGTVYRGGWLDVGHPGGLAEAEAMLKGSEDV